MSDPNVDSSPEPYVRAAHFMHTDDAALFGALASIDRAVELVVIEDPENPLLVRHAEIRADEVTAATSVIDQRFLGTKFSETIRELFEGEGSRERLVENELTNLRAIMAAPGMGVFAVVGAKSDVVAFIESHLQQPE